MRKPKSTEVDAYVFIKENLKAVHWDARNPERVASGQVWTQNECLSNDEIKRWLKQLKPENIVRVTERVLWVIEAKRSHSELGQALVEAERYARLLNKSCRLKARIISGVAGNELDSFLIRSRLLVGDTYIPIKMNDVEVTGLLSPQDCRTLLETGSPNIENPPVDEKLFLSRAQHINEILHLGAVNPHQRAGVMAALLLSMLSDTGPNVDERSPTVLIGDINSRAENVLKQQGKGEFVSLIKIALPTTTDNHGKFRKALVDTIQELNNLNIRSAMNSGVDWLGAFYEVFLKYANWAQDLGIVLTPRHITRWVADIMGLQPQDIVYDPTCGTGGFLVAAFDSVKQRSDASQIAQFKDCGLFGVEQDAGIAALAVVNMIFRGDGKNNIVDGNCFSKFLWPTVSKDRKPTAEYKTEQAQNPPVTKVMMNPPFALPRSDDKEYKFVDQALAQMQHGGILFTVLPYSAMVRPGHYKTWRRDVLLPRHTLLAVVTFPGDLFYPAVGVTSVGIFIKKGTPHPRDQKVLWIRAVTDGLAISKGKRLPSERVGNDLKAVKNMLSAFLQNPSHPIPNQDQLTKACPLDISDENLELVPEVCLDQAEPSRAQINEDLAYNMREMLAYLIKVGHAVLKPELLIQGKADGPGKAPDKWRRMRVTDLFDLSRGNFHSLDALDPGEYPTVSRIGRDNGFVGFYDKPENARLWPSKVMTVSTVTGDAFIQPVPFIATDNVVLLTPKKEYANISLTSLVFIRLMIDQVKWRYSFGRQCYKTKFSTTEIVLPATPDGEIDWSYMDSAVESTTHWRLVEASFMAAEAASHWPGQLNGVDNVSFPNSDRKG